MRKHGITNFSFQIIEENIPIEKLNEKEMFYINEYKSNNSKYGYNLTKGGGMTYSSKLTEIEVRNIINYIKENPQCPLSRIEKIFHLSQGTASDINNGDTWHFSDEIYPIRITNYSRSLTKNEILSICDMLKSQKYTYGEIAETFNISITSVSNINNGEEHKIYNDKDYPLYKAYNSKNNLTLEQIQIIINELLINKDLFYHQIADKIGFAKRKTISGINNGMLYRKNIILLGYDKFPLRENYNLLN